MTNILAVKNVNKKYKDFSLKDISFELKQGYIMGFLVLMEQEKQQLLS